MGYKLFAATIIALLISSCAAFDSDESMPGGAGIAGPSADVIAKYGNVEGVYQGTKVLKSNTCTAMKDEVGKSVNIKLDVLQSMAVVDVLFEDGIDVIGNVKDSKSEVVKKGKTTSSVFSLEFKGKDKDKTITGKEEFFETTADGKMTNPCAVYELSLKLEKEKSEQKQKEQPKTETTK